MIASKNKTLILFSSMIMVTLACSLFSSPIETPPPADPIPSNVITSAEPGIIHSVIPINLPEQQSNHAGDFDSSTTAKNKEAGSGDRFSYGTFERPFNANVMDTYFPSLDILDLTVFQDDTWTFAAIMTKGPDDKGTIPSKYAIEIDMDLDGRGDFLILAPDPKSTEWSTDGVQVLQDLNDDVGGGAVILADSHPKPGDGYESSIFDNGKGSDPDLAWARISPADANTIQLAVKRSLLGDDSNYLVGAWAGRDALIPSNFDFNDHMTHTEAGAASRGYEIYYPVKGLAEIDNTCRVPVGFQPNGGEPGLCPSFVPQFLAPGVPTPIAPPFCTNSCQYGQRDYPDCSCIRG